jgi:hypothetical protein
MKEIIKVDNRHAKLSSVYITNDQTVHSYTGTSPIEMTIKTYTT